MLAPSPSWTSSFVFLGLVCLGAAACVATSLVLVRRLRLDRAYERAASALNVGWATRSTLTLVSLSMLCMGLTGLLGAIDPAAYLSPGQAVLVYSALLLAMPLHVVVMTTDVRRESQDERASRTNEENRRAA